MNYKHLLSGFAILGLLAAGSTAMASDHKGHHWGYTGHTGPAHWGSLSPDYEACGMGKNQSPVNLTAMVEGDLPALAVNYTTEGMDIVNNGHTIQVNVAPGSTIDIDGQSFELKQFHFHSPSENTIDGHFFPLEAHFVHADADGNLAVVALMFELGEANPALEKVWAKMPEKAGETDKLTGSIAAAEMVPADHDYYRFNGSLTTPPCTEGVNWFVLKNYASVSKEQIKKFTTVMVHPNNRPVQPLNARKVMK